MTKAEKAYWEELNKMYGLNLECPEDIDMDSNAVAFDMAMGNSFDNASQRNFD